MSAEVFTSLQAPVIRTYQIGMRFEGQTRKERRQNELKANQVIFELQHAIGAKLTLERVNQALDLLCTHPKWTGTTGAAKLVKELGDRSNLGQSAY